MPDSFGYPLWFAFLIIPFDSKLRETLHAVEKDLNLLNPLKINTRPLIQ